MPHKRRGENAKSKDVEQALTMGRRGSAPLRLMSSQPGCILAARLKLGNILGEGEFGSVYKGTYQLDDGSTVSYISDTKRANWKKISCVI